MSLRMNLYQYTDRWLINNLIMPFRFGPPTPMLGL